jgi:hypothetical protein
MLLENVKSLCKSRGTSIWKLERKLAIGNGCIVRWANGLPNSDNLIKVADYFGVSIDYLLGRDENPLSADGQVIGIVFDSLSATKKSLVKQYMNLLKTE